MALVNCWPDVNASISVPFFLVKALGTGFAFLATVEQFNLGSFRNRLTKQGKEELDYTIQATLKEAKDLLDEDLKNFYKNEDEPPRI